VHANTHLIDGHFFHVFLDGIAGKGTARHAEHGHGCFAISAANLVTQQAADDTTRDSAKAHRGAANGNAVNLALALHGDHGFNRATVRANRRPGGLVHLGGGTLDGRRRCCRNCFALLLRCVGGCLGAAGLRLGVVDHQGRGQRGDGHAHDRHGGNQRLAVA